MAYSWSKWNSEVNDHDKVVFQGAEHLEDEPLLEVCDFENGTQFLVVISILKIKNFLDFLGGLVFIPHH